MDQDNFQLTDNIIEKLLQPNTEQLWETKPLVQILSLKKIQNPREGQPNSGPDRYRLIVSDGKKFTQAMLATQLSAMVEDGTLDRYCVVRVDKMTCNSVQNKRLLIILGLTVLGRCPKIADPQSVDAVSATDTTAPNSAAASPAVTKPQQQQQQAQTATRSIAAPATARPATGLAAQITMPIENLNPYQNKWVIKARVTAKSEVRRWSNQKGEGKLFSVTFMDETGQIRATGFNLAVDELYDKLQDGKVYFVSKGRVNIAKNKKFSNVQNEYEITLERNTEVEECLDQTNVPQVKYNFVPLRDLEQIEKDSICDVIGVVKDVSQLSEIITRSTQKPLSKRELTLVDRSEYSVVLTLWGKQAEQYNADDHPVIAFKGVKVGDFGGRSLSVSSASIMTINADIPEAHILRGWYDAAGGGQTFHSHTNAIAAGSGGKFDRSEVRTLYDVKEAQLGQSDKPDFFSCRATVVHIKSDNLSYPACPSEQCNKKVIEGNEGWRCEKCDKSYEKPEQRYMISMSVADYTSQAWLQGFNDVGNVIFGMSANELHGLRESDESAFNSVIHKASCQSYNFSCRARQDTYNDTQRTRYGIQRILPLDYKAEAAALRDQLKSGWAK